MEKSMSGVNQSANGWSDEGYTDDANWYERGDTLANLGQYEAALAQFDQAIAHNPSYHEAWVFRAVVLIHLQDYREALASCEQAIALHPTNYEAWLFRGAALNYLNRYKESYASYNRALELSATHVPSPAMVVWEGYMPSH